MDKNGIFKYKHKCPKESLSTLIGKRQNLRHGGRRFERDQEFFTPRMGGQDFFLLPR